MPNHEVKVVVLTSAPLPERRQRVWILGSSSKAWTAEAWANAVNKVEVWAHGRPQHHLRAVLPGLALAAAAPAADAAAAAPSARSVAFVAEYAKHLSMGLKSLSDAGRLEGITEADMMPPGKRASDRHLALVSTPWQPAVADITEMLIALEIKNSTSSPVSGPVLADLSQSAGRGHIALHGVWSTLTTSAHIFSYEHGRFLTSSQIGQDAFIFLHSVYSCISSHLVCVYVLVFKSLSLRKHYDIPQYSTNSAQERPGAHGHARLVGAAGQQLG